jgi:hypothetical protein
MQSPPAPPPPPPRMYSWQLHQAPGRPGACGVTDDHGRALWHLRQALKAAPPGAEGFVARVKPRGLLELTYDYGDVVATGRRDPRRGLIWWHRAPGP